MRRVRLVRTLLVLGIVLGFGAGFASLAHHACHARHGWHGDGQSTSCAGAEHHGWRRWHERDACAGHRAHGGPDAPSASPQTTPTPPREAPAGSAPAADGPSTPVTPGPGPL